MSIGANISPIVGPVEVQCFPTQAGMQPTPAHPRVPAVQPARDRMHDFVTSHIEFVWRVVRGFGVPRADADDVTQQVFVVAARRRETIAIGAERSFLAATARGLAANYRRSKVRKPEIVDDDAIASLFDQAPNPEEAVDEKRARALMDHVISLLEDDLREVFVLFELEEMSTTEIAAILALPSGTVASRLRRAREAFQAQIKRLRAELTRIHGGVR